MGVVGIAGDVAASMMAHHMEKREAVFIPHIKILLLARADGGDVMNVRRFCRFACAFEGREL